MSAAPLADVVSSLRSMVGDTGTGRESSVRDERLDGVDGTNKRFTTLYFPLAVGSFSLRKNGVLLADPADYSVDLTTGTVTMVAAPLAGDPIDVLQATYGFYWADDPAYYEFIVQGCREVGVQPTATLATAQLRAADAVLKLNDGLFDAVLKLAASVWNRRRAIEQATRIDSSAGGQNVGASNPAKQFEVEAERLHEEGITLRDDFYKRRGGREAPSASLGNYQGLQTGYTPRR